MLGNKGEEKQPSDDDALIKRIDEMMSVDSPKPPLPTSGSNKASGSHQPPPLNIFEGKQAPQIDNAKSAPEIPGKPIEPEAVKAAISPPPPPKPKSSPELPAKKPAADKPSAPAPPDKKPAPAPSQKPEPESLVQKQTPEPTPKSGPAKAAEKAIPIKVTTESSETNSNNDDESVEPIEISDENPKIENKETDEAVDDIIASESDSILAIEDSEKAEQEEAADTESAIEPEPEKNSQQETSPKKSKKKHKKGYWKRKFVKIIKDKRTWMLIALLVLALFIYPGTRYKILGLVIQKQQTVAVIDSKTNTPVSNAEVSIGAETVKTNADGVALVKAPLGQHTLKVTKQYFKPYNTTYFAGFSAKPKSKVLLVATGRQVPIIVINKINKQPISNASIKVLNTTAKTNSKGKAVIVLPATSDTSSASIKAIGYNLSKSTIAITNQSVAQNTFEITPTGKVYFLSNQSGKLDVVSTNLDGTGRETVWEGTGREDPNNTSLLATRDWKYLALKSRREGIRPVLYLVETKDNKVTQFDGSNADFGLIGWYGHTFMYNLISNSITQSQNGHQTVKSYDAERQQLNQLDQSQTEGWPSTYAYQTFDNFKVLNNLLIYTVQWSVYDATGNGFNLANKKDSIRGIQPMGQGRRDYQSFRADTVSYMQAAQNAPQSVYYGVYSTDGKRNYYRYENQEVTRTDGIDQNDLTKKYPIYLVSPTGGQTFWSDIRDGNNTLFVGDINAKNAKHVATLGDYTPYGWYSDKYLLVTKDNNQLYIMPVTGPVGRSQPIKISDYFKSVPNFDGYNYGGL